MKIFLYEWSCSELVSSNQTTSSIASEGRAMFLHVLNDILAIGYSIFTICQKNLIPDNDNIKQVSPSQMDISTQFKEVANQCDYAIIIAPEFNDILIQRLEWLDDTNCKNSGCSIDSVRLTGDKLKMYHFWNKNHVPTISTWSNFNDVYDHHTYVVKPRHGAGTCNTQIVTKKADLESIINDCFHSEVFDFIIQPFYEGLPISIAVLIDAANKNISFLPACTQLIKFHGDQVEYHGGECPLNDLHQQRAEDLAQISVKDIDGLAGWIGIDMILGSNPNGSSDVVVEINPRLTTSFIGLRRLVQQNLIGLWFSGSNIPIQIERRPGINQVSWSPDGSVNLLYEVRR
jgi:predicted ATP-grasp superfamily ATP-dependent carboligase